MLLGMGSGRGGPRRKFSGLERWFQLKVWKASTGKLLWTSATLPVGPASRAWHGVPMAKCSPWALKIRR